MASMQELHRSCLNRRGASPDWTAEKKSPRGVPARAGLFDAVSAAGRYSEAALAGAGALFS